MLGFGFAWPTGTWSDDARVQTANDAVWRSDYVTARATARQTGKPLLVIFR
jgi:hypothetical protein